jgi:hypothetical protein
VQRPGHAAGPDAPATEVAYDFAATHLDELRAHGAAHDLAVEAPGTDGQLPAASFGKLETCPTAPGPTAGA